MQTRRLEIEIRELLKRNPAIAILGPRQVGKTTLAKHLGGAYFDLEQVSERTALDVDWSSLCAGKKLVILDEAQSWPEIFPRLRGAIDDDRKRNGRFVLLGSVAPWLMREVSESLAGRLALVELTPFLLPEILDPAPSSVDSSALGESAIDRLWLRGGFPDGGILDASAFPRWQRDFVALLTQRDLPKWGFTASAQDAERLLFMLAAHHGQAFNAARLGQGLGVSAPTVTRYVDFLEGAYLIRRLLPFEGNIKKRLVKTPKCYLRDSGVLHSLLDLRNRDALLRSPAVGPSFEGFAIEQILGVLSARGEFIRPHYFRTSDQYEIDLVFDRAGTRFAIEIKLTSNPSPDDFRRLEKAADMIGAQKRILVSRVAQTTVAGDRISCSLPWLLEYVTNAWP